MADLKVLFGRRLAALRRAKRLTQAELASRADVSVDMITKLETGASGARFPTIESLARVLDVDAAELFTTDVRRGLRARGPLVDIVAKLDRLDDRDLVWINDVIDTALKRPKR